MSGRWAGLHVLSGLLQLLSHVVADERVPLCVKQSEHFKGVYAAPQEAIKRPDSIVRYMPVWSWEEIQAARQHIFISQPKEDVDSRYSEWGGIPRYVFQKTDMADQALLEDALDSCSLNDLAGSITNPSTASSISHRLLHLTVKAGYLKGPVVFASDWVEGEVISRYSQYKQREVQDFLAATAHQPGVAAFRGALWEHYAHMALQRGGCFSCRNLQDPDKGPALQQLYRPLGCRGHQHRAEKRCVRLG